MNPKRWFTSRIGTITAWLAALVCSAVVALSWFGYRAADEWRRSSAALVDRRAREVSELVARALNRDMRAVQTTVLDSRDWNGRSLETPYEVNDLIASAFARYPYPESFFGWGRSAASVRFFARTERLPPWLPSTGEGDRYPVEVLDSPPAAATLASRVAADAVAGREYSVFETDIAGQPYQVVARAIYEDVTRQRVEGVLGFIVNLHWVRANYFSSITDQVIRIGQGANGLQCTILDEQGALILASDNSPLTTAVATTPFPVMFFDPVAVPARISVDLAPRVWSVRVAATGDPTLQIAARGATRTVVVVAIGALAVGLGLLVTVRAARAIGDLALMRSDFVSIVTHELKTPVSVIRGIGETMIRGRVNTPERVREYAHLLVQEGHRLSRLIENLLAYSRVTDAADVYSFEPQLPADVVDESLKGFQRVLAEGKYTVSIDVPQQLPCVRADRTALVLALDNLVDNAVRYSGDAREIVISASERGGYVEFRVADRGKGIPAEDLERVQRRFVRGRSTNAHGSGLGLAIVNRIAADHGGHLRLDSVVGQGTTATLAISIIEV